MPLTMTENYNNRCHPSTTIFVGTGNNKACYNSGMASLKDRLSQAVAASGLSQAEIARRASTSKTKVSQQNVQQLLDGRNKTSKHLPAIAEVLGVDIGWLLTSKGSSLRKTKTPVICYIGAGAEMHPIDDHPQGQGLDEVDAPFGIGDCVAAIVKGDSMLPMMKDGWLVFWSREHMGVPEECLGQTCVVAVQNGPTLVKELHRGSRKGLYNLLSWNAPPRLDVKLAWAAKILDIRPK
jgi:phage repressor protein C with HTH and peptisase S24 domain